MFYFDSKIRYSEVDGAGILRPDALVNYFQDCSTFQSENKDVGIAALRRDGIAWILNYWQIDVEEYPALMDNVRIGTNPYEFKGFVGLRNFLMENEAGERIAAANSVWSLMDLVNMRPVKIPQKIYDFYVMEEKIPMEYCPRKIHIPEGERREAAVIRVAECNLDSNHHLNNAQYVRFLSDLIPAEKLAQRIRIEYRKQVFLGDDIHMVVTELPADETGKNSLFVSMEDGEGLVFAAAELVLRDRTEKEKNAFGE